MRLMCVYVCFNSAQKQSYLNVRLTHCVCFSMYVRRTILLATTNFALQLGFQRIHTNYFSGIQCWRNVSFLHGFTWNYSNFSLDFNWAVFTQNYFNLVNLTSLTGFYAEFGKNGPFYQRSFIISFHILIFCYFCLVVSNCQASPGSLFETKTGFLQYSQVLSKQFKIQYCVICL